MERLTHAQNIIQSNQRVQRTLSIRRLLCVSIHLYVGHQILSFSSKSIFQNFKGKLFDFQHVLYISHGSMDYVCAAVTNEMHGNVVETSEIRRKFA